MKKQTLLYVGLMINLLMLFVCTRVAGTLAGWEGASLNITTPANLGTKSVFGITWCTAPDRICQKSLPGVELKPGMKPGGGGYSVSPSNNIRVPERMEVSWYDANGVKRQQVVELDIPRLEEVIRRYGAPRSTWYRKWDIVLIFRDDEPIVHTWLLSDATNMGYRNRKFTPPKALVYGGNLDIVKRFLEPGEEETVIRYEPENR
ncbi:MAG: hypothetical protein KUF77_18955 [Candidatus Thiodiazotropha sp. (ex Lucina aurantia)]|nr:hypothetical protein [Candidatus Thiodiazotropha sp. (ex Lucina pensylvanica)]MBV2100911.1 hypothetical protein [Candidatus Thiodiazotropha sp. (ex Codakia orbicularis)]MBV2105112.1 hypothetical protein [Candidatus Thiodiazotropha sp. (ex Lucina aurantia)]MBV2119555.1 hypothetical protein [Candidatus Thiodiazotropha sp. (ex Lucina aurantia)]